MVIIVPDEITLILRVPTRENSSDDDDDDDNNRRYNIVYTYNMLCTYATAAVRCVMFCSPSKITEKKYPSTRPIPRAAAAAVVVGRSDFLKIYTVHNTQQRFTSA